MAHERAMKYFGDIVEPKIIMSPRRQKENADADLVDIMWEVFNGRGKRAAAPVEHCTTADEYRPMFEEYEEIDIDEALKEINACIIL